jgi:hypothetical protein
VERVTSRIAARERVQRDMNKYFPGSSWSATNAQKALPILVDFAGNHEKTTYTDLSRLMFHDKKYAHPLMSALGRLGEALELLNRANPGGFGEIPQIQLLVCNKKTGRPGNLALGFLGFPKAKTDAMTKQQLDAIVSVAWEKSFRYRKWPHVLRSLGLKPVRLGLAPPENVLPKISEIERRATGEGEEHKRLKLFLSGNPKKLGVQSKQNGDTEVLLLSGDRLDVSFRSSEHWIAVEVKGQNSPEADLIRGVFQCAKYKAIMAEQLRYESLSSGDYASVVTPRVILACGRTVPVELRKFAQPLNIEIRSNLVVPESFVSTKAEPKRA